MKYYLLACTLAACRVTSSPMINQNMAEPLMRQNQFQGENVLPHLETQEHRVYGDVKTTKPSFLGKIRKGLQSVGLRSPPRYEVLPGEREMTRIGTKASSSSSGGTEGPNLEKMNKADRKKYLKAVSKHKALMEEGKKLFEEIGKAKAEEVDEGLLLARNYFPILVQNSGQITLVPEPNEPTTTVKLEDYGNYVRNVQNFQPTFEEYKSRLLNHYKILEAAGDQVRRVETRDLTFGFKVAKNWIRSHEEDAPEMRIAVVAGCKDHQLTQRQITRLTTLANNIRADRNLMAGMGRPASIEIPAMSVRPRQG